MRTTVLALLTLLVVSGCYTKRVYDERDRLIAEGVVQVFGGYQTGEWRRYHGSGNLKAKGFYEKDVMVGNWKFFYDQPGEVIEMTGAFTDETRTGEWTCFHRSGEVSARGDFVNGLQSGPWAFYYRNGAVQSSGSFSDGSRHLNWQTFHNDGKPSARGAYYYGQQAGVWDYWPSKGGHKQRKFPLPSGYALISEQWPGTKSLQRQGFTENKAATGHWASFHKNGTMRIIGRLEGGKAVGTWSAWNTEGKKIAEGPMSNGQPSGRWTVWQRGEAGKGPGSSWTPDGTHPLPIFTGEWSEGETLASEGTESCVRQWTAEICSAPGWPDATDVVAPILDAKAVAAAEEQAPTVPIPASERTDLERREKESSVASYGTSPPPRKPSSKYPKSSGTDLKGDRKAAEIIEGKELPRTEFYRGDGTLIDLKYFHGKKNIVLVLLKGFTGRVCPYCEDQVKAYANSLEKFAALDAEIVVVYPGPRRTLGAFIGGYEKEFGGKPPPFDTCHDPGMRFTGSLDLRGKQAIPSTFVIDKQGIVQWAYVGLDDRDRPPVSLLLPQLEKLQKGRTE